MNQIDQLQNTIAYLDRSSQTLFADLPEDPAGNTMFMSDYTYLNSELMDVLDELKKLPDDVADPLYELLAPTAARFISFQP